MATGTPLEGATTAEMSLAQLQALSGDLERQLGDLDREIDQMDALRLQQTFSAYMALETEAGELQEQIDVLQHLLDASGTALLMPAYPTATQARYDRMVHHLDQEIQKAFRDEGYQKWLEANVMAFAVETDASAAAFYEEMRGLAGSAFVPKAISEFLFERKRRCREDPEDVARFFADCVFFGEHAADFGVPTKQAANYAIVWRNLGHLTMDAECARQHSAIQDITTKLGDWVRMDIVGIRDAVHRAVVILSNLSAAWKPFLAPPHLCKSLAVLYAPLVEWYWRNLIALPDIGIDDLDALHEVGQLVAAQALTLDIYEQVPAAHGKLACFVPMLKMNLIQISNAYRRGRIVPPLTTSELAHAVRAMFADSPGRDSFLAEIAEDHSAALPGPK